MNRMGESTPKWLFTSIHATHAKDYHTSNHFRNNVSQSRLRRMAIITAMLRSTSSTFWMRMNHA